MSNIIKKINIAIFLFLFSCDNQSNKSKIFIYTKEGITLESQFDFYTFKNAEYIFLEDVNIINHLKYKKVDSIALVINDTIYKAKPISILSSNFENSDFLYPVKHDSLIDLVNINNKLMFTILSVKN
jgi:hypothetical protein